MSNSRTILSRPRTRIYDSNYNIGESYYKGTLDRLDRKYSGRPLSPPARHSPAAEVAERHARIFADEELEDSRRRASKTIRDNHFFDSRGAMIGSRNAHYLDDGVSDETASTLQRIRASKRMALLDDVDLESTSNNLRTERMVHRSEKILDSVGINEHSARRAAMEDDFGYKKRALKVSYDADSDNTTKWSPIEEREPSAAVARIRQVRARMSEDNDDSQVSSAAIRARQSRARIDDIDEEMAAMSEKQAARERRVARLKALVAECESETVDDAGISSLSISEKKEKKTVRF